MNYENEALKLYLMIKLILFHCIVCSYKVFRITMEIMNNDHIHCSSGRC